MTSATVNRDRPTNSFPWTPTTIQPSGDPGDPTGPGFSEIRMKARRIAALPRHVREKHLRGRSSTRGNGALVLNPFRSLVASPTTPDTPTPVPSPGFGYDSVSFNPSPPCASTTPELSFSPFSTRSLSPPDSPYPSTPTSSAFHPYPSVAPSDQNDADPFETSVKVGNVEKILAAMVSPVPLQRDSKCVDFQGSPSPPSGAEGMVRSGQTSTDGLGVGWPASSLETPLTNGVSLSFHDTPRQYRLVPKVDAPKSNNGTPIAVFVPRSSPKIIEEDDSDEELEPEGRDDDDIAAYSFPCEDQKINELVSRVASLSLRTGPLIYRPTITPARVRVSAPAPARTPVSSPVAVINHVTVSPSTAEHATPMEVDEHVLYLQVANKGAANSLGTSDAVPMDGVVFHPEVEDVEMSDAFATNPGATSFGSLTRGPTSAESAYCRPRSAFGSTWDPKSAPRQAQRNVSRTSSAPSRPSRVQQRTVFDFLCQPSDPAVFPGSTASPAGPHSRLVNYRAR